MTIGFKHIRAPAARQTLAGLLKIAQVLTQEEALQLVAGRTAKPGGVDPALFVASNAPRLYLLVDAPTSGFLPNEEGLRYDGTVDLERARQYARLGADGAPPVLAGMRPETGELTIVDGGHRLSGARLRGDAHARALIGIDPEALGRLRFHERMFGDRLAPDGRFVADNFERWFGKSRASANGVPIVHYHGSAYHDITVLDPGMGVDGGMWLARSGELASEFAEAGGGGEDDTVYPVFVRAENPIDVRVEPGRSAYNEAQSTMPEASTAQVLAAMGHDCLLADEWAGKSPYDDTTCFVFRPEQIKSAIGNSGLFDLDSGSLTDTPGEDSEAEEIVPRERVRA